MRCSLEKVLVAGLAALLLTAPVLATDRAEVALVGSDWQGLDQPVSRDSVLTRAQIESLVRKALDQLGGLSRFVKPDHRWVVIKPNIVEVSQRGSGDITDSYVVWALVRMVHEAAPAARITIAEGAGGWISPGHPEVAKVFWTQVVDGFEATGYRDILQDSTLVGAQIDIVDLNFDESVERPVPGGGNARDQYFIPRTVLDCDVFIDVPVLKVTNSIGFTGAMKNLVGICPGRRYGWAKNAGNPPGIGAGIPHTDMVFDEMIVDLTTLGRVNLAVVDATVGMERGLTASAGGSPVRLNAIIAGADPVAVDAVAVQVAGMNPADFEFLTLAQRRGLGTADPARIALTGQPLAEVKRRFEKKPDERARYGQTPRTWLLKGPVALADSTAVDPRTTVVPGQRGWSAPVYFGDDKIDLRSWLQKPVNCAAYAYCEFVAPRTEGAELWVGSGEGLQVWIDGEQVYRSQQVRQHKLPNDKPAVQLRAGRHTLLVRAEQTRGAFDFSLNLCQVETDERYAGNRVAGLEFTVPSVERGGQIPAAEASGLRIQEWLSGRVPDWLDRADWVAYSRDEGFPLRRTSCIAFGPDSSVWVGGEGGVACRRGPAWTKWGKEEGLDVRWVLALARHPQGAWWAMTDKGAFEFDGQKWESRFGGGSFKGGFVIDGRGRIWSGGYQSGLSLHDGAVARTFGFGDGLPNINVMGLAADGVGTVWLATYGGGAIRYDGQTWRAYTTHSSGLGDNHALCVALDAQGTPWVGADAGGVSHLQGERWVTYAKEEGLGDASASCIAVGRQGQVWVGIGGWDTRERDGISVFDGTAWVTGLTNEPVTYIAVDPAGNPWFASGSGVATLVLPAHE
ncbi:MAG: DUF362 domain-containing protein [Candidatus Latescibacterota bacterium]|jgi:uncharacterized protein (DUF362 family)